MGKRVVKTVDDAMRAIAELQPEGFTVYFEVDRSFSRSGGRTSESIDFRVWGWREGGSHKDMPQIRAHSPADIVRKFIAEFLPATRPKAETPPGPIRGHLNGRQPLRLTHEPQPFRPGELFG